MMMAVCKGNKSLVLAVTVFLSVLILGGCTTIKYSYDMKTSFSEPKSYTWAPSLGMYVKDPLLEANVQVLADQILAQKGLTRVSEKSGLMVSMNYEFESGFYQDNYQLRMLTLNIYQIKRDMPSPSDASKMSMQKEDNVEKRELVWRGTAFGTISTDGASGDLSKAVQGILSKFPPK
jgi:hypothetical protein